VKSGFNRVLIVLAIILSLIISLIIGGTVIVIRQALDGLNQISRIYDPDEIKAEHIQLARSWVNDVIASPVITSTPVITSAMISGTTALIGSGCNALMRYAIARNGSTPPEITIAGFLDERPKDKLWVHVSLQFRDGTQILLRAYQGYFENCELRYV
jgi:uncharacterized protein YneF (UPF0154 family)